MNRPFPLVLALLSALTGGCAPKPKAPEAAAPAPAAVIPVTVSGLAVMSAVTEVGCARV